MRQDYRRNIGDLFELLPAYEREDRLARLRRQIKHHNPQMSRAEVSEAVRLARKSMAAPPLQGTDKCVVCSKHVNDNNVCCTFASYEDGSYVDPYCRACCGPHYTREASHDEAARVRPARRD